MPKRSSTSIREAGRSRRLSCAAALVLALAPALGGCGGGDFQERAPWEGPLEPGTRTWLAEGEAWDTLWSVGGPADTLLHDPRRIRAAPEGVVVWDAGASRLLSFGATGELRWTLGEPGSGPGEFSQVLDLQVDARGRSYLYDAGNLRVTIVDPAGRVERSVPLGNLPHSSGMAVLGDSLLVFVASSEREAPVRILDLDGQEVHRGDIPWEGFAELSSLSRQGTMVSREGRWVYAFHLGNGWFPFRGAEPRGFTGGFVEHLDFPRIVEYGDATSRTVRMLEPPRCSACTLSLTDSLLVVHFGGHSEEHHRILDLHHLEDGRYLGSWLLPGAARRAVVAGERAYTLGEDPFPVLSALRAIVKSPLRSTTAPHGGFPSRRR